MKPPFLLLLLLNVGHLSASESDRFTTLLYTAQSGSPAAQFNLARMYLSGVGVPRNQVEGLKWLRKASEQGLPAAQNALGELTEKGIGTEKNPEEAAKLFANAAEKGDAGAQLNLGLAYLRGTGLKADPIQAHVWLNIAAANGAAVNPWFEQAELKLTEAEVVEAEKLATERWLKIREAKAK
jgi:TPR repeat protein